MARYTAENFAEFGAIIDNNLLGFDDLIVVPDEIFRACAGLLVAGQYDCTLSNKSDLKCWSMF